MAKFKDHTISAKHLLGYIPEALISNLSLTTKIYHYTKVLHGNKLFYLLLYGILDNEKLSQRTLEDTLNDSVFKVHLIWMKMNGYAEAPFQSGFPK